MTAATLLVIHAAATLFMTGVIWTVQIVHYPLFSYADRDTYPLFAATHARLITPVVAPAMLVELVTGVWLLVERPSAFPPRWAMTGLAALAVIWVSTALLQVPLHGRLADGYEARAHAWLVGSNWVRTAAWTARSLLVLAALARALQSGG